MDHPYLSKSSSGRARILRYYDPLKAGSIDGTDTEPHDHGIVRAFNAEYYPDRSIKGKPKCTIFISNLHKKTNEKTLKKVFSRYGRIHRCRIVKDVVTGYSKCYGFIEYEHEDSARSVYTEIKKLIVDGCILFVDYECERLLPGWIPRRMGLTTTPLSIRMAGHRQHCNEKRKVPVAIHTNGHNCGGFGGKKESGQLRFGGRSRQFKQPLQLGPSSSKPDTETQEPLDTEVDDESEVLESTSSSDSHVASFWKGFYSRRQ